jgi:hypothetical protein
MGQAYSATQGVDKTSEDRLHKASKHIERKDVTVDATAGARTYTAAEILGGLILRDPAGTDRTDVLPTAALLLAGMKEVTVGDVIECLIINNADAAETITIAAGTGGDLTQIAATRVIPQNTSRVVRIRVTDVSTPAYIAYM